MKSIMFLICTILSGSIKYVSGQKAVNNRPIIGILTQEVEDTEYPDIKFKSYLAASYVKAVEAAGGRVVPIMIGRDRMYYEKLMLRINGVVFPGGQISLDNSDGYADAGQYILEFAKVLNRAGDNFPILGVCLGIQFLVVLASGRDSKNLSKCSAHHSIPMKLAEDFRNSKMFTNISESYKDILQHQDVTINSHSYCIHDKNLDKYNLTRDWLVTSYSQDDNGLEFISSIEHKRYPFFGIQFHPEKTAYEWNPEKKFAHSEIAVLVNRHFFDVFLHECRKSHHSFADVEEENSVLIYNYAPYFTGAHRNAGLYFGFNQCYFFEPIDQ